jgi:hypothetical protein
MFVEDRDRPSATLHVGFVPRIAAVLSLSCGLLLLAPDGFADDGSDGVHGSCAVCHRAESGFADCVDCHAYVLELPGEGDSPSSIVSGHLARDSSGGVAPGSEEFVERLECVTCHDPHAEDVVHLLRDRNPT